MRFLRILLTTLLLLGVLHAGDPLPSWNDGPAKNRILGFVEKVTQEGSPSYVAPADRIAVFDNDGTLWSERPLPFQIIYAIDRIKAMAPQHPEWKEQQPFKAILEGDKQSLLKQGKKGLLTILAAVYAGPDRIAMQKEVAQWLATAKHPRFHKPYGELRYKPMMELLRYLESKGFKNFVVSGGGIDFMRAYIPQDTASPPSVSWVPTPRPGSRTGRSSNCPKSPTSTTRPTSPSPSTATSACAPSWRWATATATWRCSSTAPRARERTSRFISITPTASGSTPTTRCPSGLWKRGWWPPKRATGWWSI